MLITEGGPRGKMAGLQEEVKLAEKPVQRVENRTGKESRNQGHKALLCYHCGTPCITAAIKIEEKAFCCEGCRLVYEILNSNGLCNYYELENHPGLSQIKSVRKDKFAYLDDEGIASKVITFTNGNYNIVTFYLPGVHCSSCMWLLEHLSRINAGVMQSRLNFSTKEVTIHFAKEKISLRQVAELLTTIGYEPYISLEDNDKKASKTYGRKRIARLGVAGFCFGNIMMMSFPEYFGGAEIGKEFAHLFRYANLLLSLPVVFYCAAEFFITAWKGLRQKTLNIDAPIALAILITFSRSIYEIVSGAGGGYLDSMSGIVFFMLVGRIVQERTYRSISFHRDYKSYFPIAVNVVVDGKVESRSLHDLKVGDVVQLYGEEIVPADGVVLDGAARIDYSFVTGESEPVRIPKGEKVYAGGRQTGGLLQMLIEKPVAGSYLTSLWNHHAFAKDKIETALRKSVVHLLSQYFTIILFSLAGITALYWAFHDVAKIIPAVSAMLIVACPCALLLSTTFTNGSLMRLLSNNGLYLRDAAVIESLGNIDSIVFDKTGTLTQGSSYKLSIISNWLTDEEKRWVYAVAVGSKHPRSKALVEWLGPQALLPVIDWKETVGEGVCGIVEGQHIKIGNARFVESCEEADVYVRVEDMVFAFHAIPHVREGVAAMLQKLKERFTLALLSGDNTRQKDEMEAVFGGGCDLRFEQRPMDKLQFIEELQAEGKQVLMLGDGLNDAGALQQSNVGITLADDVNNFTPSCDAILDAKCLSKLPGLLALARWGRYIIAISFGISILYNLVGLFFAVQGVLSPMIAAILMPASTLSIVLVSVGISGVVARSVLK